MCLKLVSKIEIKTLSFLLFFERERERDEKAEEGNDERVCLIYIHFRFCMQLVKKSIIKLCFLKKNRRNRIYQHFRRVCRNSRSLGDVTDHASHLLHFIIPVNIRRKMCFGLKILIGMSLKYLTIFIRRYLHEECGK